MIPLFKSTFRLKLLNIILFSQFIGLLIIGIILYSQFKSFLNNSTKIRIQENVLIAELLLDTDRISDGSSGVLKKYADGIGKILDARVTVINTEGLVIADSEVPLDELGKLENHINRPEVQQAVKEKWGFSIRESKTIGRKLIYVCKALQDDRQQTIGFLRLSLYSDANDRVLKAARRYFFGGGVLILLVSGCLVVFLTRGIHRNLTNIVRNAHLISEGKPGELTEINSKDELGDIAKILTETSSKLSQSFEKVTRQRKDLNEVLSSINDAIVAIGNDKRIVFHNQISVKLFNIISSEFEGEYYYDLFLNKHLISLIERFFEKPFVLNDEILLEDGRILEVVINPFKLMDSSEMGAVMVARDVTNYRKLERVRRDFVANVSHEFKNPLASIQGYAETLLDWAMDDPKVNRKYLEKIVRQAGNLEHLVTDLLQLARVEGLQRIEMKTFDPVPILKELKFDFSELTTTKQISLKQVIDEKPITICGDPEMFRTIMANLIDNAIKYSQEGGEVTISIKSENGFIEFSVKDTGIGIPQKYISRIFERFFRVDKARSRDVGGTGLGLSIVKHMAELQRLKYGVESEVNTGSRFWVRFKKG
jgi:two-component system phosphate regulon sensor histidine kinase PhoR